MASTSGFQRMPGWYFPDDIPKDDTPPGASQSTSEPPHRPSNPSAANNESPQAGPGARSSRRTHWPPRQCRICLETVQPTTNAPSENLPGIFQTKPNVTYEDESGRLIRPCLCKGSSKYVHEACLQAWRHADPSYGRRNYFQCPTCGYQYRLARLGAGRFVASVAAQIILTVLILFLFVFFLGFVADPIINLYVDPWSYLTPWSTSRNQYYYDDDEASGWIEHFLKGFTGMGVIGFLKVLLASPFTYFRIGGGRGRNTGRDRYEQVSWIIILIGVSTFLVAIWKGVRAWSRRTLQKAGERVMDVPGDDDNDADDEDVPPSGD
ncbi:RING finger domain-containing protein [Pleomassaria siparia CBS 279.74]|uniref:RING finger domain-containing protein n=1 Tax=Pleomassaria siparia CBS 279.74 TaxID=1314801 RepID=A0A6G1KHX0_9PLEO|nr:RING finger domain-containing protein [Pleomassaria siparia CBS 279.74]